MDIYDEVFNELIRQVTINCPERGILLSKVRDEMKITAAAYKSLYDSSVTFGMRKQVQAEEGIDNMKNRIEELERKKKILQNQVRVLLPKLFELQNEYDSIEKGYREINDNQKEEFKKEIEFLHHQNTILNDFYSSAETFNTSFKEMWNSRATSK